MGPCSEAGESRGLVATVLESLERGEDNLTCPRSALRSSSLMNRFPPERTVLEAQARAERLSQATPKQQRLVAPNRLASSPFPCLHRRLPNLSRHF